MGLAGHKDPGSAGMAARLMGKGVEDSEYSAIGRDNAQDYDGKDSERNDESNQQTTQVRPTFR